MTVTWQKPEVAGGEKNREQGIGWKRSEAVFNNKVKKEKSVRNKPG